MLGLWWTRSVDVRFLPDQGSPRTICGGMWVLGPSFLNFDFSVSFYSTSVHVCLGILCDRYRLYVSGRTIKVGRTPFERPTLRCENNIKKILKKLGCVGMRTVFNCPR